jgi:hypothetical protein
MATKQTDLCETRDLCLRISLKYSIDFVFIFSIHDDKKKIADREIFSALYIRFIDLFA